MSYRVCYNRAWIETGFVMVQGGEHLAQSNSELDGCRMVHELLQADQYEQVIESLHKMQAAVSRSDNKVLAHILDVACRICLACEQCRAEVAWHQQAGKEAQQREYELKRQLYEMLRLLDAQPAADTSPVPLATSSVVQKFGQEVDPKSARRFGWWQRFRNLFKRKPSASLDTGSAQLSTENPQVSTRPFVLPQESAMVVPNVTLSVPVTKPPETPVPLLAEYEDKIDESPVEVKTPPDRAPLSLVVYCLGSWRVYNNDQVVEKWPGRKCKSVFKYLLVHREHSVHREVLMDLFWRDANLDAARRNLYQAIYRLRQTLRVDSSAPAYILCQDSCYSLNPDVALWLDSKVFAAHYLAGQRLERKGLMHQAIQEYEAADNLYEGDFLVEDVYEDWTLTQRENLKHIYFDVLDRVSRYYYEQGQFEHSITYSQKILVQDNCREDAHRRLMRCYLYRGQRHLALRQYHRCVEMLEQELDVSPMPVTVELYEKIQNNERL